MIGNVQTICFMGIKAMAIGVQVQVASGFLPSFSIVGLPDKAINEAKERIRSVLYTLGIALPSKRITINLTPANIQKEGSHYDLPIILSLFMAMGLIPEKFLENCVAMGEMGLDGALYAIKGSLCGAIFASEGGKTFICPGPCAKEASWAGNISIIAPYHLLELMEWIKKDQFPSNPIPSLPHDIYKKPDFLGDFKDIKGQEGAKRAMLIGAAGRHNILLSGPPGVGKSMLASRLVSILPPLTPKEALESTMIHSLSGTLKDTSLLYWRPLRSPHHSISSAALVGGGSRAMPGEISLAHGGVLFLDELSEFSRYSLDALRQSLETKEAVVSRVNYRGVYPADFQLVGAMNPCRCGHLGDSQLQCSKAPNCSVFQKGHLSLPFLDRLDLFVSLPPGDCHTIEKSTDNNTDLSKTEYTSEKMAIIVQRVWEERQHFLDFLKKSSPPLIGEECNSQEYTEFKNAKKEISLETHSSKEKLEKSSLLIMSYEQLLEKYVTPCGKKFLAQAAKKFRLSFRGYYRILHVAQTIAFIDKRTNIIQEDIAEALGYPFRSI